MRILFFLILSLASFTSGHAQHETVSGKILDADTQEPLAFVNISLEKNGVGTTSNIEGRFTLMLPHNYVGNINFSFVGYENVKIHTKELQNPCLIKLKKDVKQLQDVVVLAGENPAYRIIRGAIINKHLHNPYFLPEFKYKSYNKMYITLAGKSDFSKMAKDSSEFSRFSKKDSATFRFDKVLEKQYLFLNETIAEKKYKKPNNHQETILGNKVSGFQNPMIFSLATSFQPFSFYEDNITIVQKEHLNPLSKGSISKYEFHIEDTTFINKDTVYIISFEPRLRQKFEGLKGLLFITTDGFAVTNVIAENADDHAQISFKIQQQYDKLSGHWFPVQLHTDLLFKNMDMDGRKMHAVSRSYLKEIDFNPYFKNSDFEDVTIKINDNSLKEGDLWLSQYRNDTLNFKEKNTYFIIDSVVSKSKISKIMNLMEVAASGLYHLGKVDIEMGRIMNFNQYEKWRLGIGLRTNSQFSKILNLSGYAAYGFGDQALKYGTALDFHLYKKRDLFLQLSIKSDIEEVGNQSFIRQHSVLNNESFRSYFAYRFDSIRQYKAKLNYRPFAFSQAEISLSNTIYNPAFTYQFVPDLNQDMDMNYFNITEFSLGFRYAFGENYLKLGENKIFLDHKYPLVQFRISKGLDNLFDGQFSFWKLDFRVTERLKFRNFGTSDFTLVGGLISGAVPYSLLYNGRGGFSSGNWLYVDNHFQTMNIYEFTSERFLSIFHNHNFGNLLIRRRFSRPEFVLNNSFGIGSLSDKEMHKGVDFKTMEKGFFESGLIVNNLLRINYLNAAYFNFGIGGFYRYGTYQQAGSINNFAARMTVSFSF
jgi:hypothetical protein